jgi:hypothetical protein
VVYKNIVGDMRGERGAWLARVEKMAELLGILEGEEIGEEEGGRIRVGRNEGEKWHHG